MRQLKGTGPEAELEGGLSAENIQVLTEGEGVWVELLPPPLHFSPIGGGEVPREEDTVQPLMLRRVTPGRFLRSEEEEPGTTWEPPGNHLLLERTLL